MVRCREPQTSSLEKLRIESERDSKKCWPHPPSSSLPVWSEGHPFLPPYIPSARRHALLKIIILQQLQPWLVYFWPLIIYTPAYAWTHEAFRSCGSLRLSWIRELSICFSRRLLFSSISVVQYQGLPWSARRFVFLFFFNWRAHPFVFL